MTPRRFRFIDCAAFIREDKLRIVASDSETIIDSIKYAAISYPWKGNCPERTDDFISTSFAVEGAELGDRIALDVLQTICAASVQLLMQYVWLDRLCVMQTCREDKNWQIQRMALIYERCSGCLIIPGGLGRVVGFQEKTLWIYRAWTLQEALLPPEAWCLFRWERDEGIFRLSDGLELQLFKIRHSEVDEDLVEWKGSVHDSSVGILPLMDVLLLCTRRASVEFTPFTQTGCPGETMNNFILFSEETKPILALVAAAKARESRRERAALEASSRKAEETARKVAKAGSLPDSVQDELEEGGKVPARMTVDAFGIKATEEMTIWRCAIMRTSKKEVDIVYSIMSLFGVNLDRSTYTTRRDALIALCQAILQNGGSPQWFGASFVSPVFPTFCTMPSFPCSASKDIPMIETSSSRLEWAHEMVGPFNTYLDIVSSGTLDEDGFIGLTAPMSAVSIDTSRIPKTHLHLEYDTPLTLNDRVITAWITANDCQVEIALSGEVGTHAVDIGKMQTYAYLDDRTSQSHGHWLMLVSEVEDDDAEKTVVDKWHKTGMAILDAGVEEHFLRGWERKKIRIGAYSPQTSSALLPAQPIC